MRRIIAVAPLALLMACGLNGTDRQQGGGKDSARSAPADTNLADAMASVENPKSSNQPDPRPVMQAQVVLERLGFGPGVIDGAMGLSTRNALKGFQEASGLSVTGELDDATRQAMAQWNGIASTRTVTIPADWGQTPYVPIPDDPAAQARMTRLGYASLDERLAERFHTTIDALRALNGVPVGSIFSAGQRINVPNIGADRIVPGAVKDAAWIATMASLGVGSSQPKIARIVVDKSEGWLKGYDKAGKLVAMFTVTTGSRHDPLPLGEWGINGVARNTPFAFDPDLFWDVPDNQADQQLPPGPNGPVGVVWIDLTKPHYGIHGTAEPQTIGRAQSHGCVRLTNWDVARLAQMVSGSTKVLFQA
ncbi:MAG: hypothetical protein RLZZ08_2135 [Pseudomonadota bacterium]|jgi:lipoprotein-anchoring transpeptidase ErfK/SrfK